MRSILRVTFFAIWAHLGAAMLAQAQTDPTELAATACKTGDDRLITAILGRLEYADKNLPLLKKGDREKFAFDTAGVVVAMFSSDRDMIAKLEAQIEGKAGYRLYVLRNQIEGMLDAVKPVLNRQAFEYGGKPKPITLDNPEAEKLWRAIEVSMRMPLFMSSLERFFDGEQGREYSKLLANESAQMKTDASTSSQELAFFMACKLAKAMASNKPIAVERPKTAKIVCKTIWAPSGRQDASNSYAIDFARKTVNGYDAVISDDDIVYKIGKLTVNIDRIASTRSVFFDGSSNSISGDCTRVEAAAF